MGQRQRQRRRRHSGGAGGWGWGVWVAAAVASASLLLLLAAFAMPPAVPRMAAGAWPTRLALDASLLREPRDSDVWRALGEAGRPQTVATAGDVAVQEWAAGVWGRFRGLTFRGSRGIEGGHAVRCSGGGCRPAWDATPSRTPPFEYLEAMALAALALRPAADACTAPARVLHLGLGAGTLPLWLHDHVPAWHQTAVEVSASVLAAVPALGVVEDGRMALQLADGAAHLAALADASLEVLFLDAYDGADEIPSDLRSAAAVADMRRVLAEGGLLVANVAVGMRPHRAPEYLGLLHLLRASFAHVSYLEASFFNRILVAHDWGPPPTALRLVERAAALPDLCHVPALWRGASTLYSLAEDDWEARFYRHRWAARDACYERAGDAACLLL